MRFAVLAALVFSCLSAAPAAQPNAEAREALLGYDPVILAEESREVLGDEAISLVRDNFWYLFVNEENKRKFESDPRRYEIQLGGLCARMGGLTPGDPDNFLVHEGRIYIFGSDHCRELFAGNAKRYLDPGRPEIPLTAESEQKGRELIDKAVAWLGGAERLDGLRSLRVKGFQELGGERTEVEVARVFEHRYRHVVRHPRYGEFGELMDDAAAYRFGSGGYRPMSDAQRENLWLELSRDHLGLLRARRRKDFQVAWLGSAPNDSGLERVWVGLRDFGAVLEIEADGGAIRAVSYTGRGPEGEYGEIRKEFGDIREVSGLRWPFAVKAQFDGKPCPEESFSTEAIQIDEPLESSLFRPPAKR